MPLSIAVLYSSLIAWLALVTACKPVRPIDPSDLDTKPPIPLSDAQSQLAEAAALCAADAGNTWNISLCGPLMVVDRETRFVVATQADTEGFLQPRDGVFVGTLPPQQTIANTSLQWAGVHWVQLVWPLPADRGERGELMMHEQFHRIAPRLSIKTPSNLDNGHLDSVDGRYWMQLEWRALAAALRATAAEARRSAIADALAFRRARRGMFAPNAAAEDALELGEGIAEYTGVVVTHTDPAARTAAALRRLTSHASDPSFVRSFAYATGPAYGLFLDELTPGWRGEVEKLRSLSDAVATALALPLPDVTQIAARYDGAALRAAENDRAARRAAMLAQYRQTLVDGPVVTLAFNQMKLELDPNNVVPLDTYGTVYTKVRIIDEWGVLDVRGGALIKADWSAVVVTLPTEINTSKLAGNGWTLELAAGWTLLADKRSGDFRVARAP